MISVSVDQEELRKVEYCVSQIQEKGINLTPTYEDWLQIGFSLANYGEKGKELFHKVSSTYPEYDYQETEKKYENLKHSSRANVSIATFFHKCKEHGIVFGNNNGSKIATREPNNLPTDKQETTLSYADLLKYLFSSDTEVIRPNPVISINDCVVSTAGNVTTIAGQSKAGKSGITGAILAGCMSATADSLEFDISFNSDSKGLIHIDTEQSAYDHYRLNKQILSRAGLNKEPDWYYSYNLRHLMPGELITATDLIFNEISRKHSGLHLAVIDGIAEYVVSPNDDKESFGLVHFFANLSEKYQIPVVLILHYNPGSEKGRGHLGSQLERKSESYLSISKNTSDNSISVITAKLMRNASADDFGLIEFEYNREKGYHTYLQAATQQQIREQRQRERQHEKKFELKEIAVEMFSGKSKLSYSKLTNKVKEIEDISLPTAKRRVKYMLELSIIYKGIDNNYYLNNDII